MTTPKSIRPAKSPVSPGRPPFQGPIDRREFVGTTGTILVAAAGLSACGGTDIGVTGTILFRVTGLGTGLPDAGTVLITRTDIASQNLLTVPIPAFGSAQAEVPTGTYFAIYTPPAGYQTNVANEFDIEVLPLQTTYIDSTVFPVANEGTLQLHVTGLTAATTSAGTVRVERTDIAGISPVTVPVPLTGTASGVIPVGTYTLTYTPPTGFAVTAASVNPAKGLVVALNATTTVNIAVASASYQPGDILDNWGFETPPLITSPWVDSTGAQTFVNNANPPNGGARGPISFDTSRKYAGTRSLKRVIPTTTNGGVEDVANIWCMYGRAAVPNTPWLSPQNPYNTGGNTGGHRLYSRFYFYIDQRIDGILKFNININYGATADQAGGWYLQNGKLVWTFACVNPSFSENVRIIDLSSSWHGVPMLGHWHSLEVDYWVGTGTPTGKYSAILWIDDIMVTAENSLEGTFVDTRLEASAAGNNSTIGSYGLMGVLNAGGNFNSVAGNIWIDRISISTLGRVGP